MSDTPRTEAEINRQKCWSEDLITIDADFCRQLERELNAANAEIEEKRKDVVWLATEKAKLENYVTELENRLRALWDKYYVDQKHYTDRIKRLEEALDLVIPNCSWVHHSKKHQHKCGEPCPVVALIEKSKEDKL